MTRRVCGTAVALLLLAMAPAAWSQQYYLYSPKPASPDEKVQKKDGVLVQEVSVQKGDTLSGLSRKFSGHGSYYSQILLFNDIKNPDLIYAGKTLRVPVSKVVTDEKVSRAPAPRKRKTALPAAAVGKGQVVAPAPSAKQPVSAKTTAEPQTEIPLSDLKRIDAAKPKKREARQSKTAVSRKQEPVSRKQEPLTEMPRATMPRAAVPVTEKATPAAAETVSGQKLFERAVRAYRQDDCRVALDLFERFLFDNPASPLAADASLYKAECYLKLSSQ